MTQNILKLSKRLLVCNRVVLRNWVCPVVADISHCNFLYKPTQYHWLHIHRRMSWRKNIPTEGLPTMVCNMWNILLFTIFLTGRLINLRNNYRQKEPRRTWFFSTFSLSVCQYWPKTVSRSSSLDLKIRFSKRPIANTCKANFTSKSKFGEQLTVLDQICVDTLATKMSKKWKSVTSNVIHLVSNYSSDVTPERPIKKIVNTEMFHMLQTFNKPSVGIFFHNICRSAVEWYILSM